MSKISFEKQITSTIQTLKKVFDELEISAYLIGAQARDVWFLPKTSPRITRDIDWVTEGVTFDNGITYQVATLPSIVLLKLIAYADKPEYRAKDVEDIAYIFANFDIYTDDSFPLFTELEPEFISARTIGRKINYIVSNSHNLKSHVIQIIENQITKPEKSRFIQIMIGKSEQTERFIITQLKELLKGLNEVL